MDVWSPESSYTVVMTDGKQSVFYTTPIPWHPCTITSTSDPHLGAEKLSFSELWSVGKPVLLLTLGWGLGVATGALGLVWLLR